MALFGDPALASAVLPQTVGIGTPESQCFIPLNSTTCGHLIRQVSGVPDSERAIAVTFHYRSNPHWGVLYCSDPLWDRV